jgi:Tfp pilus assembly protein PilX
MAIEKKCMDSARARQQGAALVVILLSLVLFATLITGFLVATRLEQMASRNFSYQNIARNMAFAGAQHAISQLNQAAANEFVATRPGMLTAVVAGSLTNLPLSSAAMSNAGPTNVFLNVGGVLSTNTNNVYFSAPEVPVETSVAGSNRVTGRFAYWVDDDGTKANLNAMTPGARTNFAATNSRPFGSGVFRSNVR